MLSYLKTLYRLQEMNNRAYWPRSKLLNYQNKRLRNVLTYAYDFVPFYHGKFRQAGIKPDDIKTVSDLDKLPIAGKNEISENLNSVLSKEFEQQNLRALSTSGSTGKPLRVVVSKDEDSFRKAKHLRANMSCGHKPFDRWVTVTSPSHFSEATRLQQTLSIYAPVFVSVFADVRMQLSAVAKIKPDILDGYSSSLFMLAKEADKTGVETIKPKSIFGGAELADNASRRFVEDVFDAPFYDQYATIEFERMAWQCPAKFGYHIDADALIMQFVDENGEEVAEGENGEIVCTSLFNYAMPFIRYAIGDTGIPSNEECPCGRKLPLMKIIEGRKDSLLFLPNGRILSPRAFTVAVGRFPSNQYIEQYRVTQKKIDYFEIQIIVHKNVNRAALEKELVAHLEEMLTLQADEVTFEVRFVEEIPLDKSGKLMIVGSELKQPSRAS